jgi:hypothetical protein
LRYRPFTAISTVDCKVLDTGYKSDNYPTDDLYSFNGSITYSDVGVSLTDSLVYWATSLQGLVSTFNTKKIDLETKITTMVNKFTNNPTTDYTEDSKQCYDDAVTLQNYYTNNKSNANTYYNDAMVYVTSKSIRDKFKDTISTLSTNVNLFVDGGTL